MPSVTFQETVGTTRVQASDISRLSSTTPCRYGVRLSIPSTNSGSTYYGGSDVTTSNGILLQNGTETTINNAELILEDGTTPSLDNLYFVASTAGQVITGGVLS